MIKHTGCDNDQTMITVVVYRGKIEVFWKEKTWLKTSYLRWYTNQRIMAPVVGNLSRDEMAQIKTVGTRDSNGVWLSTFFIHDISWIGRETFWASLYSQHKQCLHGLITFVDMKGTQYIDSWIWLFGICISIILLSC